MFNILHSFTFICFSALLYSCGSGKHSNFEDTDMYDFSNPKIIDLPTDLDEISGIVYYPKDTSVFAIVDEAGILYKIPLKNPQKFQQWRFAKNKDFEEVVLVDSTFYVLVSNGDIEKLSFKGEKVKAEQFAFFTRKKKKNEFEILYKSPNSNELILICKDCEDDDKEHLSTYIFSDTAEEKFKVGPVLDMRAFSQEIGVKKHLKPSAAAINPITGELYLVSAIQNVVLILSPEGIFKTMVSLDPRIYKQPEGITFTPEGNLIISNEFAKEGLPNLLLLKNKKQ